VSAPPRRRARSLGFAAVAGGLFGAGLVISGMVQPARVLGFLTATSAWDPSLAFVMVGAVAVYALALRICARRPAPWFDTAFHLPTRRGVDARLVAGAAVFGVGWGLAGLCPGPSLVNLGAGSASAATFVAAMLVGMILQRRWASHRG
jgi:uncharacterized membrane protein YedE/YeeE